jgi:hypothetical protein
MTLSKWEYKICACQVKITHQSFFDSRKTEGYWTLDIDGVNYSLDDGLAKLGEKGWELAGVQTVRSGDWYKQGRLLVPESYYVFKRPF